MDYALAGSEFGKAIGGAGAAIVLVGVAILCLILFVRWLTNQGNDRVG